MLSNVGKDAGSISREDLLKMLACSVKRSQLRSGMTHQVCEDVVVSDGGTHHINSTLSERYLALRAKWVSEEARNTRQ